MNDWISVKDRLPAVETEIIVCTKNTITTALYEDGTVRTEDSIWTWEDIDGEWDEERDCEIVPEGWWEYRHYNPDCVYNNKIDEEVLAWMPLPEPYKESKEA